MRHEKGVLDTSAVLRLHELEPEDLPVDAAITTVTLAELSVGPLLTQDDEVRAARLSQVQRAETDYGEPIPFDVEAARSFAQVAADIRRSGRKPAARAFDALIAATAKAAGLPLYTFNADDLRGVTGLEIVALPPERGA
ncbi:PIN domain-containing protein [Curtobacterium ammoniigenes]|uniref:PIN domain-containing protein n=1 Tax=Curtobacterium ammoniigenes TaxID=395387 RepID=UPI000831E4FB|nr:PIN domain-containing protein [Curtobacterium ammoniigenes]